MSTEGDEGYNIEIDIDPEALQASLSELRGVLRTVTTVRNLIEDTVKMAQQPSLSQAFWLGMQVDLTSRSLARGATMLGLGDQLAGAKFVAQAAIGMVGLPVAGAVAGAVILTGGYILWQEGQRQQLEDWKRRQVETARNQGLVP